MKATGIFFEKCAEEWRDGFLIPVRNRMGNMIEREYLPREMKDAYIEKFGEEVIYDDTFTDWYCEMKKK